MSNTSTTLMTAVQAAELVRNYHLHLGRKDTPDLAVYVSVYTELCEVMNTESFMSHLFRIYPSLNFYITTPI